MFSLLFDIKWWLLISRTIGHQRWSIHYWTQYCMPCGCPSVSYSWHGQITSCRHVGSELFWFLLCPPSWPCCATRRCLLYFWGHCGITVITWSFVHHYSFIHLNIASLSAVLWFQFYFYLTEYNIGHRPSYHQQKWSQGDMYRSGKNQ